VTFLPLAAYLGAFLYVGVQAQSNRLEPHPWGWAVSFRPEAYTEEGRKWRFRAKVLFWSFPVVGIALSVLGRLLCADFPVSH